MVACGNYIHYCSFNTGHCLSMTAQLFCSTCGVLESMGELVITLSQKSDIMQQKSERVTMVKKSDCHSKIVTVDRYASL